MDELVIDGVAACLILAGAGQAERDDVYCAAQQLLSARVGDLAGDVITMAKAIALARLEELQASSGRSFCPARLSAFEAAVRAVVREAAETDGA